MCDLFESAPTFPPFFIMEDEEILSSSCSSADEQQELQGLLSTSKPSLNESVVITGCYTPTRENLPLEISNRLIETTPEDVHVQHLDHTPLNSTLNLTDEEDSGAQASSNSVQDDGPSEYVEKSPSFAYDILGRYDYEITDSDGKPFVPPNLIPEYFTSRIHYGFCGRCTRAQDFGYANWMELENSGNSKALERIGSSFCPLCGLDCSADFLLNQHVESVHMLRGWFPRLDYCPECNYQSCFPESTF